MKRASRNISWIHLAPAAAVCFMFVTEARADQLVVNEFQATSSSAIETTPTLGSDNGQSVLVYTSINLQTFTSRVRYQLLTDTGILGAAVDVGSGNTNDNLNDVSGDSIVYTATETANPGIRQIRKYRISTGDDDPVSGFGALGEARIHGGNIAWIEGTSLYLSVAGALAIQIAGPVPAASELEIGDSFVVWQQEGDIWAYDVVNGGSSKAANGGNNPSTSGSWVVWQSAGIIKGSNLLTGATVALGNAANVNANPSIDGNNIAWESDAAGNFDIYLHRIAKADTFMVTTNLADQELDSLHSNQVAYRDNRDGFDIYVSTFSFAADPEPPTGSSFSCGGFESPMDGGAVKVKKNRVLPLKAQLFNGTTPINNFGITAPPAIQILFDDVVMPTADDVTNEALSAGAGTDGNQFEFLNGKWQFNLKTRNYSAAGTYTITMESGDATEYQVNPTCTGMFVIN